jgi:hypothetical protein
MTINQPIFVVGCGRSGTTLLFDPVAASGPRADQGHPRSEDHTGWIAHGGCAMAGIGNPQTNAYGSAAPGRVLTTLTEFCRLRPHQFDTSGIAPGTSARHSALLTPVLVEEISHRADPVRRHFGYVGAGSNRPAFAVLEPS